MEYLTKNPFEETVDFENWPNYKYQRVYKYEFNKSIVIEEGSRTDSNQLHGHFRRIEYDIMSGRLNVRLGSS